MAKCAPLIYTVEPGIQLKFLVFSELIPEN